MKKFKSMKSVSDEDIGQAFLMDEYIIQDLRKQLSDIADFLKTQINRDNLLQEIQDTAFWHARSVYIRGVIREYKLSKTTTFEKMKAEQYNIQRDNIEQAGKRPTESGIEKAILLTDAYELGVSEMDILKALDQNASGLVDACLVRHAALKHMSEYMIAEKTWGEH